MPETPRQEVVRWPTGRTGRLAHGERTGTGADPVSAATAQSPDIQLASQPHRDHLLAIKHAGQVRQLFLWRCQRLHRGPVLLSRAEYQIKIAGFDGIDSQQPGRLRE